MAPRRRSRQASNTSDYNKIRRRKATPLEPLPVARYLLPAARRICGNSHISYFRAKPNLPKMRLLYPLPYRALTEFFANGIHGAFGFADMVMCIGKKRKYFHFGR